MDNRVELRIDWTTNQSHAYNWKQIRVKKKWTTQWNKEQNGQQIGVNNNRMNNRLE